MVNKPRSYRVSGLRRISLPRTPVHKDFADALRSAAWPNPCRNRCKRGSSSMSSSGLARLGGLAAVMADSLLLTTDIIDVYNIDAYRTAELNREYLTTGTHAFQSALRLVAFGLLLPLGLVGLYARQSEATGPLGPVAFVAAFAGTVLVSGFVWVDIFLAPELATSAPGSSRQALP